MEAVISNTGGNCIGKFGVLFSAYHHLLYIKFSSIKCLAIYVLPVQLKFFIVYVNPSFNLVLYFEQLYFTVTKLVLELIFNKSEVTSQLVFLFLNSKTVCRTTPTTFIGREMGL